MPAGGRLAHQLILEGRVAGFLRGRARECRLPPPRTAPLASRISPACIRTGNSVPDSPPDPCAQPQTPPAGITLRPICHVS